MIWLSKSPACDWVCKDKLSVRIVAMLALPRQAPLHFNVFVIPGL